jgi:hypothetical protein
MNVHWRDHLQARLLEIQPASLFALDEAARQLARDTLPATPVHGHDNPPDSPCALALGVDFLNALDTQLALHRISQTRLYLAPRMLLVARPGSALDEATFRALGFTLYATDPTDGTRIHDYDLDTYKTVPDWLNARYWAHPERWQP